MKGKHPKRRRDKYNPYKIYECNGRYYIAFKDGQGRHYEFEISRMLYEAFDSFELEDISYLNVWDRHIEQSEVWESSLNERSMEKPDTVEEIVFRNLQAEMIHKAIWKLPEIQRRRLILYFFGGLSFEEIGKREGCSKVAVKYTVDKALEKIKKELE